MPLTLVITALLLLCFSTGLLTGQRRGHKNTASSVLFTQGPCHCAWPTAGHNKWVLSERVTAAGVDDKGDCKLTPPPPVHPLHHDVDVPLNEGALNLGLAM